MNTYEITYGESIIKFKLERKNVKNINLNIKVNGDVVISANEEIPIEFIKSFVIRKASWINKNLKYYKDHELEKEEKKELVSGETLKYLGRQYRLKVVESKEEFVKYFRGYVYLYVRDKGNYKRKEELLNTWYNYKCKKVFNDLYNEIYPMISKYNVPNVKINVRTMKTRWGSCISRKNTIILNKELIKAPKYCIKYVILHELIHMMYNDHNKEFYDFLYVFMPD
ncbi:SprT family zinc-dependent metalloprotease [Paraclostridium ghonii]|uniref:M48 family metallopeptidase n=1 Tax=Paraclostridium ghonii TaxID=29358 RepID=UPI00202CC67B|nr:SprT family zinc-dependent metalloprotease [Paeniclostridium ghonii]MCM0166245.1 M48 family metallopeptidase [Paeniclostridium ghonii]